MALNLFGNKWLLDSIISNTTPINTNRIVYSVARDNSTIACKFDMTNGDYIIVYKYLNNTWLQIGQTIIGNTASDKINMVVF